MKLVLVVLLVFVLVNFVKIEADYAKAHQNFMDFLGLPRINFPIDQFIPNWFKPTTQKPTTTVKTTTKPTTTEKTTAKPTTTEKTTTKPTTTTVKSFGSKASTSSSNVRASTSTASATTKVRRTSHSLHPGQKSPGAGCRGCSAPLQNWGGNFNFSTADVKYPTTTAGVQQLVRECKGKIRPVGTRHSFSEIANTKDTLISMTHMNLILGVNPTVPSVTVQAGITYTDLIPFLHSIGLALPMMASLGEITIAGAIQTGVHGSGAGIGNLATQVLGLQMVLADGSIVQYNKGQNDTEFAAAAVGLGALGVITQVTLKLQPAYDLAINVFENMDISVFGNNMDDIVEAGYAVNLWSTFSKPGVLDQVWITSKIESDGINQYANASQLYGATAAPAQSSPIAALPPTYVVPQMGIQGPWYERLNDYDLGLSGQEGQQTQSEYYVAYDDFVPALRALQNLSSEINAIVYVALFRVTEKDDLWMSPQYNKTTMAIHFSWQPKLSAVMTLLPKIEAALAPFNPIPHWGKLFTMKPRRFLPLLPKYAEWRATVERLDPSHKFRNKFLEKNIFV